MKLEVGQFVRFKDKRGNEYIRKRDNKTKIFLTEDDKKKFTSDYIDNHNIRKE